MKDTPLHRGATGDPAAFAEKFVEARLAAFEKDMNICLAPTQSAGSSRVTHAYFPALSACCGMLEYLAALHRGSIRGIGWQQVANWAEQYLPQPDYDRETVRVLVEAFRHPVAHRGIASGIWVDRHRGAGHGRRLTWKVHADARRPGCDVVAEAGCLRKDPPWEARYTYRVHVHLRALQVDIRRGGARYKAEIGRCQQLETNFFACMRQLYPT